MSYTISNTEKTKSKGADYETLSSLYMLGYHSKRNDIRYVFVDCFNDISCSDDGVNEIYDIQAKGYKSISTSQIGRFLYTLLKNFQSNFPFADFILFLETIDDKHLLPMFQGQKILQYSSFTSKAQNSIEKYLEEECKRRENKKSLSPNDLKCMNDFLKIVQIVVCHFSKLDGIKKLIPLKNTPIKTDEFYEAIFDELKRKENELKLINLEGIVLNNAPEILQYEKFIEKKDIDLMLINRFIGTSLFEDKGVPLTFISELNQFSDIEDKEDFLQTCKSELAKMFFNKNQTKNIWKLLVAILDLVEQHPKETPSQIYSRIPVTIINHISALGDGSVKFFIAKIQEGLP